MSSVSALASADDIRQWSHGEVKEPETINYRTLRPTRRALLEKSRSTGLGVLLRQAASACASRRHCERCGHRSKVRRADGPRRVCSPVTHIWYFKGVPSRLGYLLDLAPKDLEKVIYFAAYMITRRSRSGTCLPRGQDRRRAQAARAAS